MCVDGINARSFINGFLLILKTFPSKYEITYNKDKEFDTEQQKCVSFSEHSQPSNYFENTHSRDEIYGEKI